MVLSPLVLGTMTSYFYDKTRPIVSPSCFFHGKFKGSSILHHGHVHLFDMNSGMAILYVQCHTTQEIS